MCERNIIDRLCLACFQLGTWPAVCPGMCPDGELNQRFSCLQAGAQSTEPHQPGLYHQIKTYLFSVLYMPCSVLVLEATSMKKPDKVFCQWEHTYYQGDRHSLINTYCIHYSKSREVTA